MTTKIQRWGNSLALRIPKAFATDAHLSSGAVVNLSVAHGRLVIEPSKQPKYTLAQLLKRVTKSNLHSEVSGGEPQGREIL